MKHDAGLTRPNRRLNPVLVMNAEALGMIGVIRSLGRAGYPVHAASCHVHALGLRSRLKVAAVIHPSYDDPAFIPWLTAYCRSEAIKVIVPSEGFLHAIAPTFERFRSLIPDAPDPEVWQRCLSKVQTLAHLMKTPETESGHPPGVIIRSQPDLPALQALIGHGGPFYIKADAGFARSGQGARVLRVVEPRALPKIAGRLLNEYQALLCQAHAPGLKVGVSLWRHQGTFRAENMTLGIHQNPHTGGMMSLRRTWWHERLLEDAKRKMEALEWQGVAMMEYKWDPVTDDFRFIEINARYWGYLHLDLFSGKDFPRLQLDGFFGSPKEDMGEAARAVICRHTVPGDWGYLISKLRDPTISGWSKACSAAGFLTYFAHPTMRSDLLFPGDRTLYWRQWYRFLTPFGRNRSSMARPELA